MINTESGRVFEVAEAVTKIEGVGVARAVAGQYDVIAYINLVDMTRLGKIIKQLQQIPGVRKTQTSVAIPRIE